MSIYIIPLIFLPSIVVAPGEYLTRSGERVTVQQSSTKHDFGCNGLYVSCGTSERWHKSGRILATSETMNDIVTRAEG
ncbi:hypothetical protein LCGC14_0282830 [marine sediment metagenome]|uniref:Uncharacterized protein n=1 Tax=marine sediment metagenome TaxID=412755 RepID=A0A0F9U0L4_9ZZZZ